jgi:hypothetical protein
VLVNEIGGKVRTLIFLSFLIFVSQSSLVLADRAAGFEMSRPGEEETATGWIVKEYEGHYVVLVPTDTEAFLWMRAIVKEGVSIDNFLTGDRVMIRAGILNTPEEYRNNPTRPRVEILSIEPIKED